MNAITTKLQQLIEQGADITNGTDYDYWRARAQGFLDQAVPTSAAEFRMPPSHSWSDDLASRLGFLEGLTVKLQAVLPREEPVRKSDPSASMGHGIGVANSNVFIVHGHDGETKEAVARYVQAIGLNPIILHEQPNSGRTIIEKFEVAADVGFAIVLLTPDDIGASAKAPADLHSRARQNVIMELGYFMGRLSRRRVCALHKASIELPSDIQGVVYIEIDEAGAWKTKLAQELVAAGFTIDLAALLRA